MSNPSDNRRIKKHLKRKKSPDVTSPTKRFDTSSDSEFAVQSPRTSLTSPSSSDRGTYKEILNEFEFLLKQDQDITVIDTPKFRETTERRLSQIGFKGSQRILERNQKTDRDILDLSLGVKSLMASTNMANNSNTAIFAPIISTGDVVNLEDLIKRTAGEMNEWFSNKLEEIYSIILQGKTVNQAIKEARALGKTFMRFRKGIVLNINPKSEYIMNHDLTRTRFMAVLHAFIYEKTLLNEAGIPYSPLISKVTRESLTDVLGRKKFLLGSGFQYQSRFFTGAEMALFYLGCFLLDYIASLHVNSKNFEKMDSDMTLRRYIRSELGGIGDTLVAGARNAKDMNFACFISAGSVTAMLDRSELIKFDFTSSGTRNTVSINLQQRLAAEGMFEETTSNMDDDEIL